jgi:hypothetical protein
LAMASALLLVGSGIEAKAPVHYRPPCA